MSLCFGRIYFKAYLVFLVLFLKVLDEKYKIGKFQTWKILKFGRGIPKNDSIRYFEKSLQIFLTAIVALKGDNGSLEPVSQG